MKNLSTIFKALSFILAIFLCLPAQAQKRRKKSFYVNYVNLPANPLPEEIKTYEQILDINLASGMNRSEVLSALRSSGDIPGFEKVTQDADLTIRLSLEDFYLSERSYNKEEKEEKRGDTKIKVTYHSYSYEYKYPLYFELKNNKTGEIIEEGYVPGTSGMKTKKTSSYKQYSELTKYWNANYKQFKASMKNDAFKDAAKNLNQLFEDNYSFAQRKEGELLYYVKPKKHNYDDYTEALDLAVAALTSRASDTVQSEEYYTKLKGAIALWETALTEADLDNKRARVNKKIALNTHYNCVVAYYWMNDFENAKRHIQEAINIQKKGWTTTWTKLIEKREQRYLLNFSEQPVEASN